MTAEPAAIQSIDKRVRLIQALTVAWMSVEFVVSLVAAWRAHSLALFAFAGDSIVELLSGVVVWWRFRSSNQNAERWAARAAGILLFAVAGSVVLGSGLTLFGYSEAQPSYLGIGVLIAAAVLMPLLAKEKRRLSSKTGSAALRADASESALCGYMSIIALIGLVLNSVWHISWADPVAALLIVPLVVREGWEAVQGKACDCC